MEKQIGAEAKLKAEIVEGKVKLSIDQMGTMGGAGAYVYTTVDQLVDALCDLIPGDSTAEKAAAALLKSALNNVKV